MFSCLKKWSKKIWQMGAVGFTESLQEKKTEAPFGLKLPLNIP